MTPEPGIYESLPHDVYHGPDWDLASSGFLGELIGLSPMHARYRRDHRPVTAALRFGDAFHLAVLQPDLFGQRYDAAAPCAATKKDGKPCRYNGKVRIRGQWYCQTHKPPGDADYIGNLTPAESLALHRMHQEVHAHKLVSTMLRNKVHIELSGVWDEPTNYGHEIRCKLRVDLLTEMKYVGLSVVDFKSTQSARKEDFEKTIYQRRYHVQAAHYLRGMATLGIETSGYFLVAVEKEEPHACVCYHLDEDAIESGNETLEAAYDIYASCVDEGKWPGYASGAADIGLPMWAAPTPYQE
jgi:hypothetical protein